MFLLPTVQPEMLCPWVSADAKAGNGTPCPVWFLSPRASPAGICSNLMEKMGEAVNFSVSMEEKSFR